MNQIPCINPTCTHLFDVTELSGMNLKCPKCGQVIQMRAHRPAAPPAAPAPKKATPVAKPAPVPGPPPVPPPALPASPAAKPAAPVKPAVAPSAAPPKAPTPLVPPAGVLPQPSAPSVPRAVPIAAAPQADDFLTDLDTSGYAAPRLAAPSRGSWLKLLALAFIVLGSILAVVLYLRRIRQDDDDRKPLYEGPVTAEAYKLVNFDKKTEQVFKIVLPKDKSWDRDEAMKKKLKGLAGWWDDESKVWLIVNAQDFGLRKPRDAELLQMGLDALNGLYEETLEMEQTPEKSKVAGHEAQKLKFKGRDGASVNWGEFHYFSHHGIGYVVYVVGAELEKCQETLDWLEKHNLGLAMADDRKAWREQPPEMTTFVSISGSVTLKVPENVYERYDKAKDPDAESDADLTLLGRYRKEKDNRKNAHVQVFRLAAEVTLDDAWKKAKDHVLAQWATAAEGAKLIVSPDAAAVYGEAGKKEEIAGKEWIIGELCGVRDEKRERLFVVGVAQEGDRLYLIACDVVWDNRQIWVHEFHDLIRAARIKAK